MDGDYDQGTGELVEAKAPLPAPQQTILPMASRECAQVWTALAVAQGAFEAPKRTKEGKVSGVTKAGREYSYSYKYAPLDEVIRVVAKPLADQGLYRQQYLVSRGGQWFIRTVIGHSSGEWIAGDYPVYADKPGAQGFASGITYARRYGLSLALGLAPEDDDDAQVADSAPARDERPQQAARTRPLDAEPEYKPAGPVMIDAAREKAGEAYRSLKTLYASPGLTIADLDGDGVHSERVRDDVALIRRYSEVSYRKLLDEDAAVRARLDAEGRA